MILVLSIFSVAIGGQFTYKHSESIRRFQEAIAAVVDEDLDKDLSRTNFYSLIDESTDIATDHNLVKYV